MRHCTAGYASLSHPTTMHNYTNGIMFKAINSYVIMLTLKEKLHVSLSLIRDIEVLVVVCDQGDFRELKSFNVGRNSPQMVNVLSSRNVNKLNKQ